ncbi:unnamed protein product [Caretta caretta]
MGGRCPTEVIAASSAQQGVQTGPPSSWQSEEMETPASAHADSPQGRPGLRTLLSWQAGIAPGGGHLRDVQSGHRSSRYSDRSPSQGCSLQPEEGKLISSTLLHTPEKDTSLSCYWNWTILLKNVTQYKAAEAGLSKGMSTLRN